MHDAGGHTSSARQFRRHISGHLWVGGALCAVFALAALISFVLVPYDIAVLDIPARLQPPGLAHLLGTDHFGRDILSMIVVGARISIAVAFIAVAIGVLAGIPLGLLAAMVESGSAGGARGGLILGEAILRLNDLIFAFPAILLALMLTAVLGAGAFNAIIAIGIFNIPVFARLSRAAALAQWKLDYVLAAQAAGKGRARISIEHILPNILNLVIVQATIQFSLGILAEAALSYIGIGVQPPTPSWGRMLADGQTLFYEAPHIVLFPGLAIVGAVLGLNLMGDGIRDFLDPRARRH